jgi:transposase
MGKANRFSPEVRERAVRLVGEQHDGAGTQWSVIKSVAAKIGCMMSPGSNTGN